MMNLLPWCVLFSGEVAGRVFIVGFTQCAFSLRKALNSGRDRLSFCITQNPVDHPTDQGCKEAPYGSEILSEKDGGNQA